MANSKPRTKWKYPIYVQFLEPTSQKISHSSDFREAFNLKNQCRNILLIHKFPKEIQKSWWNLRRASSSRPENSIDLREASYSKKKSINIFPKKKPKKTNWSQWNPREGSSGWWASTSLPKTILSAITFPITSPCFKISCTVWYLLI